MVMSVVNQCLAQNWSNSSQHKMTTYNDRDQCTCRSNPHPPDSSDLELVIKDKCSLSFDSIVLLRTSGRGQCVLLPLLCFSMSSVLKCQDLSNSNENSVSGYYCLYCLPATASPRNCISTQVFLAMLWQVP